MGDSENAFPASKKRVAGRELSRDNPGLDDEEDASEQETGTFKRASNEVLATRKFIKVRRHQPPSAASSNPFSRIQLVPLTESCAKPAEVILEAQPIGEKTISQGVDRKSDTVTEADKVPATTEPKGEDGNGNLSETKIDEPEVESAADMEKSDTIDKVTKPERGDEREIFGGEETDKAAKEDNGQENTDPAVAAAPLSSFQQLSSSQNAFTGLVGTGFSGSSFSFGTLSKDGPANAFGSGSGSGSLFGLKNDKPSSYPSFSFGKSNNGNPSLFSTSRASNVGNSERSSIPSMQDVPVETGEENEKVVFTADAVLFEYLDGGWKERGKGEIKVNVSTTGAERARLVMRARGNYRLILNACIYPDMKLTNMDKRGITFACINSTGEGRDGLSTFALKFKDGSIVEEFYAAVLVHKSKMATFLKTPENSPKALDD